MNDFSITGKKGGSGFLGNVGGFGDKYSQSSSRDEGFYKVSIQVI